MQLSEKQFNSKATMDAFDEIYTNYDLSVNENYSADGGYPFDYPTRWLNDPSMNKRIAIRRLNITPSSHSFTLSVIAGNDLFNKTATIDVTEYDNLIKVLNALCNTFKVDLDDEQRAGTGLRYVYNTKLNELKLFFVNALGAQVPFIISSPVILDEVDNNIEDFMKFLNQDDIYNFSTKLSDKNNEKIFNDVWNRDRVHFHASFSTSRRKFIGKRGDFYQTLTLLYPPPTNESTFYIKFTSNGIKNILLKYCDFDVQLCFIVNYKKSSIL